VDDDTRGRLDGLAYIRAVRDGELAPDPFMRTLGMHVTEAEPGRVVMEVTPRDEHLNLGGLVHGGFLSTLMDNVSGYALHTTLAPRQTPPHLAASYRFMTMAKPGISLRATGMVLRSGRNVGHVRTEVHDADGRLIATGETTHAVVALGDDDRLRPGPST
jgi:acyl-CoA thioesterase